MKNQYDLDASWYRDADIEAAHLGALVEDAVRESIKYNFEVIRKLIDPAYRKLKFQIEEGTACPRGEYCNGVYYCNNPWHIKRMEDGLESVR